MNASIMSLCLVLRNLLFSPPTMSGIYFSLRPLVGFSCVLSFYVA